MCNNNKKFYYRTVLFDLDGTLTDSGPAIARSVTHALEQMNLEALPPEVLRAFVGPPLIDSFMQFAGLSEDDAKTAIRYYRDFYRQGGMYEASVYPGIPELLEKLKKEGRKICLATSKPRIFAEMILRHFDLDVYFDAVSGPEMNGLKYTKAQMIRNALEKAEESDVRRSIMIGDRKFDIEGAKEWKLDSIGVLFGYGNREEFEKAGATYVANDCEQIYQILSEKI